MSFWKRTYYAECSYCKGRLIAKITIVNIPPPTGAKDMHVTRRMMQKICSKCNLHSGELVICPSLNDGDPIIYDSR